MGKKYKNIINILLHTFAVLLAIVKLIYDYDKSVLTITHGLGASDPPHLQRLSVMRARRTRGHVRECVCWPHITALKRIQKLSPDAEPTKNTQKHLHSRLHLCCGCRCRFVNLFIFSFSWVYLQWKYQRSHWSGTICVRYAFSHNAVHTQNKRTRKCCSHISLESPELEPALVQPLSNCIQIVITFS